MEHSTAFDLDEAIGQYIDQVNSDKILSEEEKDQIYDHFHNETASLQNSGLNAEEAFFIAKMRFGESDYIQKEFAKAKPWNSLLQLFTMTVVIVLGVKLIMNVAKALSFLVILAAKKYSPASIEAYLKVGDWVFQTCSIAILLYLGYVFLTKSKVTHIKHLWPVPFLFCLSLVTEALVLNSLFTDSVFTGRPGLNGKSYAMVFYDNSQYINMTTYLVAIITSLWVLYQNRNQRIQIA